MDYLYTDLCMDSMWRGITCRRCGARPQENCRTPKGNPVTSHAMRRHDVVTGRVCECGKCVRNIAPKRLDTTSQN